MYNKPQKTLFATKILPGMMAIFITLLLWYQPSQARNKLPEATTSPRSNAITPTPYFITSFGGEGGDMVIEGNYAYVADGTHLVVYDITDSLQPAKQADLHLPGSVQDLQVKDGYLYLSDGSGGFRIYNALDLSGPVYRLQSDKSSQKFLIDGDYVYIQMDEDSVYDPNYGEFVQTQILQILDIVNPDSPVERGQVIASLHGELYKVGNYIYCGNSVINVSNPDSPVQSVSLNEPLVDVATPYAFTSFVGCGMYGCDGDVYIYDISNPGSPSKVGDYKISSDVNILVSGNLVYLLSSGLAYGLDIVSISDPAHPTLVGNFTTSGYAMNLVANHLFVFSQGFVILDVCDPAHPNQIGAYSISSSVYDQFVSGSLVYLRASHEQDNYKDFYIVNISDLSNITQASLTSYRKVNEVFNLDVSGKYGYLISGNDSYPRSQFQIVDFRAPNAFTFLGEFGSLSLSDLKVIGDNAYISEGNQLDIFDVHDVAHPVLINQYGPNENVKILDNRRAYLIRGTYLQIVDLSQPLTPTLLGECLDTNLTTNGDYILGEFDGNNDFAFLNVENIKDNIYKLNIFDTSDPSSPKLAGIYSADEEITSIQEVGNKVYLTTLDRLEILDITNPASPVMVGWYSVKGFISTLLVQGNLVYLANLDKGVLILDVSDPTKPRLIATYASAPRDIQINGSLLYIAGDEGVQVVGLYPPSIYLPLINFNEP